MRLIKRYRNMVYKVTDSMQTYTPLFCNSKMTISDLLDISYTLPEEYSEKYERAYCPKNGDICMILDIVCDKRNICLVSTLDGKRVYFTDRNGLRRLEIIRRCNR